MLADAVAWVFRTPRRLFLTVAGAVLVVVVGGGLLFDTGGTVAGASGAGGPDGSGGGAVPSAGGSTGPSARVPDASPYVTAAVAFVRAWSRLEPGQSKASWLAALRPMVTPELARELGTTDPANLPGAAPAGEPVVRFVAATSSLVAVPLQDGSSVLVTVVAGDPRPLVSDIQPNVGD